MTSSGGGYRSLLKSRPPKVMTAEEKLQRGREAIMTRLGEEEYSNLSKTFKLSDSLTQDGMILSLISQGYSQIQIRGIYNIGGYRITRLLNEQKSFLKENDDQQFQPELKKPSHAVSEIDVQRIKSHINDTYDLESGFACQHRQQMLYFADEKIQWKDVYESYQRSVPLNGRILSQTRHREYIKSMFPNLRLHRTETDLCNACYRLDIQLKDPSLSADDAEALLKAKELHLEEAKAQRRAMNTAIKEYTNKWFGPSIEVGDDPCLDEIIEPVFDNISSKKSKSMSTIRTCPVSVTCEDYGQAISLPSYRARRPNADYFNSDLHLQMFNICHMSSQENTIYLYDERVAGKNGDAVNSLRWHYHCNLLRQHLDNETSIDMALKVMDNCCGQNKSNSTMQFDALLSLLLYKRVANFYLLPGHSHMRPDQVTALCKNALKRKDLFLPEHISEEMSKVENMYPKVITTECNVFKKWETFLQRHFLPMPDSFTKYYCFEMATGKVIYKKLTKDDSSMEFTICPNVEKTRAIILKELLGLPPNAKLDEIIRAPLLLPDLESRILSESKIKSLEKKLPYIPAAYRGYYPHVASLETFDRNDDESRPIDDEPIDNAPIKKQKVANVDGANKKVGPGRPKRSAQQPQSTSSIMKFLISRPPASTTLVNTPSASGSSTGAGVDGAESQTEGFIESINVYETVHNEFEDMQHNPGLNVTYIPDPNKAAPKPLGAAAKFYPPRAGVFDAIASGLHVVLDETTQ